MRQETLTFILGPVGHNKRSRKFTFLLKKADESQDEFLVRLNHLGYGGGQLDKLPHHWSSDGREYHPGTVDACRLCVERRVPVDVSIKLEKQLKTKKDGRVCFTISMSYADWVDLREQIEDHDLLKTLHWLIDTPEAIKSIRVPVGTTEAT